MYHSNLRGPPHFYIERQIYFVQHVLQLSVVLYKSLLCTASATTFTSALQNSTCGHLCSTLKETGLWTAVPTFELLPS